MFSSFITLTTIGFGDMVPSQSFLGFEKDFYGKVELGGRAGGNVELIEIIRLV